MVRINLPFHVRIALAALLISIVGCSAGSSRQSPATELIPSLTPEVSISEPVNTQVTLTLTSVPLPTDQVASPTSAPKVSLSNVHIALREISREVEQPTAMASSPNDAERMYVTEKAGRIKILQNDAVNPTSFLDIADRVRSTSSEQGLLGIAFDPEFSVNGFFYVDYTDLQGNTVISRFSATNADSTRLVE